MEGPFSDWARLLSETEAGRAALRQWEDWASAMSAGDAEAFRALTDPRRFLFFGSPALNAAVERLVGAPVPQIAEPPSGDAEWAELRDAFAGWASLVSAAWTRALAAFSTELAAAPALWEAGARVVAERWFAAAGAELDALIRDPVYVEAQRRLIRAAAEARIAA